MDYNSTTTLPTNLTNTTETGNYVRDENLARAEILLQIIIFVLAVLGNSTVLVSLLLKRKRLSRMHLLMVHLSVADLFVAFGSVLPQIAWDVTFVFKGGDILCRLVKYMQVVAIYASSYVLVMTAIDRYVAICWPFTSRKWSPNMVHKLVLASWALSLLFSVPQTFIFSYKTTPYGQMDCWASFEPVWTLTLYITVFTILVYILPTGILTFCYGNICLEVWRSSRIGARLSRFSKRIKISKTSTLTSTNGASLKTCRNKTNRNTNELSVELNSQSENYTLSDGHRNRQNVNGHGNDSTNYRNGYSSSTTNSNSAISNRVTPSAFKLKFLTDKHNKGSTNKCKDLTHMKKMKHTLHQDSKSSLCNEHEQFQQTSSDEDGLCHTKPVPPKHRGVMAANRGASIEHSGASANEHRGATDHRKASIGLSAAKIKTVKLTLTVVLCYFLCWSPFFIAQMWAAWDESAPFYGAPYTIILLLASLNSCTNPWIYLIFSDSVCFEVKQCATRVCRCQRRRRYSEAPTSEFH